MSLPIQKAWMREINRKTAIYKEGVKAFVTFARENSEGLTTCPCPCKRCRNKRRAPFDEVSEHLMLHGMDQSYCVWVLHGEKFSMNHVEQTIEKDIEEGTCEEENIEDGGIGLGDYVDTTYGIYKGGSSGVPTAYDSQTGASGEPHVEADFEKRYMKYKKAAEEKLYPSCEGPYSTLSVLVELQNMKKEFGWSGRSLTVLLSRLGLWLPRGNTLPNKYPVMKEMLKDLGMKATRIDACANNCILYWKDHRDATECPQCKMPRYKVQEGSSKKIGRKKEENKVLRHFPLIPRLQKLYTIPWIAHSMTWHKRATPSWDVMRHPIDSSQWRRCRSRYLEFAKGDRNVWLAIATDGFNPRGIQSTSYSCWPVILVPYNLPPSLCMKREFHMLSLLIPGPKAPGKSIDVFLEPLIDELIELWDKGVDAYDMYRNDPFTLKAMLMWGVHDHPANGNLSSCITHGYKACPVCGDDTASVFLETYRKVVYPEYTMFLRMDHPFRNGKFLRQSPETRTAPDRLSGQELLQKLSPLHFIPGKVPKSSGKKRKKGENLNEENSEDDEELTAAWYKKPLLYKLFYWPNHQVRHVIDVMHVEKNVAEHILFTIFDKSKNSGNARGEGPHLLNLEEKRQFCQTLKDLKLPSYFSSNLSNIVTLDPPGLLTMKSHDYHVIMEYLLPILLQHAFPKHRDLRKAIHQISLFFNLLCSKVVVRAEISDAKYMVAEALCVLRKYFPLSFFDISIHLVVHLADEALICGPVRDRWMYPFERSMKDFKKIPSNKRYVEGSIAESYLLSESVTYAMEYMPNSRDENHKSTRESFLDKDGEYIDEGPLLDGKIVTLRPEQFVQIRRWVLFRLDVDGLEEKYSEYRASLQSTKGKGIAKTEVEIQTEFIKWMYDKMLDDKDTDSVLWRLVRGPLTQAKTYRKYRVNGFVFSTKYHDDTVVTQDNGVYINAITTFAASKKDKNTVDVTTMWYGVIQEIIELDYTDFKEVVFYCDWVRVDDKTNGCKLCPDSNLVMVNFQKFKSSDSFFDEPVILASDAKQVFYSKDLKKPELVGGSTFATAVNKSSG